MLFQGLQQVFLDVVPEGLQRGDVEDVGVLLELCGQGPPKESVQRHQEGGQRLSGAGGRGQKHVLALEDGRPALQLRGGRDAEAGGKPALDEGMKVLESRCPHGGGGGEGERHLRGAHGDPHF